jgi:putative IMPACT (imprinted ancient) family translation regulator
LFRLGPRCRQKIVSRLYDGEPNHSAGDPILGQIRSKELTNVLIVVVRYFGGAKLGVGGLINAYKLAAADALANAMIVEKNVTINVIVYYDYPWTAEVMRLVRDLDLVINGQSFEDTCVLNASCKIKDQQMLLEKLTLMKTLGQIRDFTNP